MRPFVLVVLAACAAPQPATSKAPPEPPPPESIEPGPLDEKTIHLYMRPALRATVRCYEPDRTQRISGTVLIDFEIGLDGAVTSVSASGFPDERMNRCAEEAVRPRRFPRPLQTVQVNDYPMRINLNGSGAPSVR